jgi:hypothetical protein
MFCLATTLCENENTMGMLATLIDELELLTTLNDVPKATQPFVV